VLKHITQIMNKTIDYHKLWMVIGIIALMLLTWSQCDNNASLEKRALADAKAHEQEARLLQQKNDYLIHTKMELEESLANANETKNKLDKQRQKVKTITKVVIDTTIANKYLKDRYKDNSIQVVNDLIQGDVCRAENVILEKAILNRDSIIVFNEQLYKNEVQISNNLNSAVNELNLANKEYKDLLLNEQLKNKKQKRQNFFLKAGIVVLGGALILK
jgi:hypothetical protein